MVRIRDVAWALTAAAMLAGPRPASADSFFTGNVANDFTAANNSVVLKLPMINGPGGTVGPTGETAGILPSGAFIKSVALNYDPTTDTMRVGLMGYTAANGQREIMGDITGNTNPGADFDASATNNFLGLKSIALAFAPTTSGAPNFSVIAGIPANKPTTATPDFQVSSYAANGMGLAYSFGQPTAGGGQLAFNPSAGHPDFEFSINHFSQVAGFNPATTKMTLEGFIGDPGANGVGKAPLFEVSTPGPVPQTLTPEPTTWLAWMIMAAGAGWRYRRRLVARV